MINLSKKECNKDNINKQKIGCAVDACKYNDESSNCCTLKEIKVSCDCGCADCKDDTICSSFECKK